MESFIFSPWDQRVKNAWRKCQRSHWDIMHCHWTDLLLIVGLHLSNCVTTLCTHILSMGSSSRKRIPPRLFFLPCQLPSAVSCLVRDFASGKDRSSRWSLQDVVGGDENPLLPLAGRCCPVPLLLVRYARHTKSKYNWTPLIAFDWKLQQDLKPHLVGHAVWCCVLQHLPS